MHENFLQMTRIFDHLAECVIAFYENTAIYINNAAAMIFQNDLLGRSLTSIVGAEPAEKLSTGTDGGLWLNGVTVENGLYNIRTDLIDEILILLMTPVDSEDNGAGFWTHRAIAAIGKKFRDPLSNMFYAIDYLSPRLCENADEKTANHIAIMNHSRYKLLRLSGNIVDLAEFTDNSTIFTPVTGDIVHFLQRFAEEIRPYLLIKGIELKFYPQIPTLYTNYDSDKIKRLLLNLISNSIKNTRDGNIITIKLTQIEDNVCITLSDLGTGMSSKTLDMLFTKVLGNNAPVDFTGDSGQGLGLPIVNAIARLHGGVVLLESREGEGTSVTVSFPLNTEQNDDYLKTTVEAYDRTGGFSAILVELSDVLPYHVYWPLKKDSRDAEKNS